VGAAEALPIRFQSMPNDPAPAMLASRRQRMNRAFKAVKDMALPAHHHFKALVVVVSANFTLCHKNSPEKSPPLRAKGATIASPLMESAVMRVQTRYRLHNGA
jgi:hypothetical protein